MNPARYVLCVSVIASLGRVMTVAALTALACGAALTQTASASCVGPMLSASPTTLVPGQRVTLVGRYWTADCNDVIVNGATPPPERPGAAHLVFVQDGRATPLGDLVADAATLTFRTVVRIPNTAHDGAATIEATGKVSATGVSLHVTGASPTASETQLPFTGMRDSLMVVLATLLIGLGAALCGVGNCYPRRR